MADLTKALEYAEEKLSRLHPDERDKPHIGMMVESGFLKEIVELLKEQREKTELCDRCGRKRLKSTWEGR